MKVLIVEDDARVSGFLERGLKAEGYRPQVANNASSGISMAKALQKEVRENFESAVLILDVMLPDGSGLDVCQTLRAEGFSLPILMLTALNSVEDRVAGLRMGADDYLGKPFAFDEILARLEALGRRVGNAAPKQVRKNLEVADLNLDLEKMRLSRAGREIQLTAKELALVELLMSAPGRLFSRERILSNVWGVNEDPLTNVVDVYIRRLRAKIDLEGMPPLIHTQRGLGYRLESLSGTDSQ
ncbi:response regulator transcription factor [Limnobacter alexandrii]|jgi:DNA-binding response OmpR family regulator|uniref:response regulator transcription factor n=1 Tax=Limnobacter alexandrii TaxID=2570352 RepID=UPI001109441E|nr:response regulator transcription factor [Limnobacter alexandrii]